MRYRRFSTIIVFLIPLLVLTWIAAVSIRRYYRTAERDVRPILEQELTRTLEHETRVGKVTIQGGYAYIDDVHLAEGKTFADLNGREIARAKQVVVDVDLRRILLSKDKTLPLFSQARVIEPVAYARRNADGRWNFQDLFKPRPRPPARPGVGIVTVTGGTIYYEDHDLPHHSKRRQTVVISRLRDVNGTMEFYASRGATWQASIGGLDQAGPTRVVGSYDPQQDQVLIRVVTSGLQAPLLSRFFPPDAEVTSGTVSGRITLTRTVNAKGVAGYDYQTTFSVADGAIVSGRVAEPLTGLRGDATVTNDVVTLRADGQFAGSSLHTEGTVLDFSDPAVNGWAQGNSLQLGRILTALKLDSRVPQLRQIAATASVRANLRGPLSSPVVTATGPVGVRGALPGGVNVGESGTLQVAFSGTVKEPRVSLSGSLPLVKYKGYSARDVRISGVYDGRTGGAGAIDLNGKIGGGTVAARASLRSAQKQVAYRVEARVRDIDLSKLPLTTASGDHPTGRVRADVFASGATGSSKVRGHAQLEMNGLEAGGYAVDRLQARVRSDGERLFLEPALISDSKGVAIVSGSAGLRDRTLDLRAQVDNLDLSVWPVEQISGGQRAVVTSAQGPVVSGLVYLRDVSITGAMREPAVAGRLFAYNLRSDRLPSGARDTAPLVDYVVADFRGDRQSLTLNDGRAYRFPSMASVSGVVSRPLSPDPRISLSGSFHQVDVTDVSHLAGVDLDASGLVGGSFEVVGTTKHPEVIMPDISVQSARVGEFDFQTLTAGLRYSPFDEGGLWAVDHLAATHSRPNVPPEQWTTVTASGRINGEKQFALRASLDRLDLELVEPYLSDFVTVSGMGEASVDLTGRLREGKAEDLSGEATVRTRGLTVNRVAIGDLHGAAPDSPAHIAFREDRITSNDLVLGSVDSGISVAGGTAAAPALVYDADTDALRVNGKVQGLNIDLFRQILTNSPYVSENPESIAARWLKPITNPFEGTIGGTLAVSGSAKDPVTTFDWATTGARIQGNAIDGFVGSVTFTHEKIDLKNATLTAGDTIFTAAGSLVPNKDMAGNVDTNNMPIALIKQWFPGRPILRDLDGVAESVHLTASGDPANPTLTASVLLRDVVWIETVDPASPQAVQPVAQPPVLTSPGQMTPKELTPNTRIRVVNRIGHDGRVYQTSTTGREVWISSLDTSTVTVNSPQNRNKIQADNVHVTLREPDPLPTDPKAPRVSLKTPQEFKIYAHGESAFDWQNMDVLKNPAVRFEVNVPSQPVNALIALVPHPQDSVEQNDITGTIRASLLWAGTIQQPKIEGSLDAKADHIQFAKRATRVRDLNAALEFTGETVRVKNFTAFTDILDPRTKAVLRSSDEIRLTGSIALTDQSPQPAEPLHLTVGHFKFAETALPGLQSGRFVTDDTGIDLTATGSLLQPLISGTVDIRTADIRLPSEFAGVQPGSKPVIEPAFNIKFVLGNKVRVVSSPLSAIVRTSSTNPIVLGGDIQGGDTRRLKLNGTLVVNGGTLAFPTARFTLQQGGRVQLRYPYYPAGDVGQNEPTLGVLLTDVRAVTHLTAAPANNPNQLKRYTITVEANGPLNSGADVQYQDTLGFTSSILNPGLRLAFRADPPDLAFSDAELRRRITARLGGETAIQGLFASRPDIGRLVRQQVTDVLSESFLPGLLEQIGFGRGLGFEEFAVDISQLNTFSLRLSRHLFGPVYLGYWQRLSGPEQSIPGQPAAWEFKLSYRFRPQVQFSFTTDDQRTNAYLLEGVFRF